MPYPAIAANKIHYDKDGTLVGTRVNNPSDSPATILNLGIVTFLNDSNKSILNGLSQQAPFNVSGDNNEFAVWFLFPKLRTITNIGLLLYSGVYTLNPCYKVLQGSDDTTNGIDGTWVNATYSFPTLTSAPAFWRSNIIGVSFGKPIKALRFCATRNGSSVNERYCAFHLYGSDAVDDGLIVTDAAGAKLTSLVDLGDTQRGGVFNSTVYVKNASASAASGITVDIEGTEYKTSFDNVTFDTTQKTFASLAAGAVSPPIYVRFNPVAGTALGPSAGRILVNGTFTA